MTRADHFLVLADGRPVAFIDTYLIVDYPEWAEFDLVRRQGLPASISSSATRS